MVYSLDRRTVMAAGAASLLTPIPAWSQDSASRLYRLTRDGSDIGTHQLTVSRIGDTVTAKTDISIAVKFLGITAYRYELTYSEVYRGGLLQQLNGTANDDGDAGYVNVIRQGDALEVDGSDFSGAITGAAMPTSYWRQSALSNTPWISTQSGELLRVSTAEVAPLPQYPAGSRIWRATDGDEYTVDIAYDAAGEWLGCSFDAKGETIKYALESASGSLTGFAV